MILLGPVQSSSCAKVRTWGVLANCQPAFWDIRSFAAEVRVLAFWGIVGRLHPPLWQENRLPIGPLMEGVAWIPSDGLDTSGLPVVFDGGAIAEDQRHVNLGEL